MTTRLDRRLRRMPFRQGLLSELAYPSGKYPRSRSTSLPRPPRTRQRRLLSVSSVRQTTGHLWPSRTAPPQGRCPVGALYVRNRGGRSKSPNARLGQPSAQLRSRLAWWRSAREVPMYYPTTKRWASVSSPSYTDVSTPVLSFYGYNTQRMTSVSVGYRATAVHAGGFETSYEAFATFMSDGAPPE